MPLKRILCHCGRQARAAEVINLPRLKEELRSGGGSKGLDLLETLPRAEKSSLAAGADLINAYRAWTDSLDRKKARKRLRADNAGRRAVAWLTDEHIKQQFQESYLDRSTRPLLRSLMNDLAHVTVGAGREDLLWDLSSRQELIRRGETLNAFIARIAWKGFFFAGLCEAVVAWGDRKALDGAMRYVAKVHKKRKNVEASGFPSHDKHFLIIAALVAITRMVDSGAYFATDPKAYDRFVEVRSHYADDINRGIEVARLMYRHPLGARPDHALEAYRKIEQDPHHPLRAAAEYRGGTSKEMLLLFAKDIAYVLRQHGREEDADWITNFANATWPRQFYSRSEFSRGQQPELEPDGTTPTARVPMPTFNRAKEDRETDKRSD